MKTSVVKRGRSSKASKAVAHIYQSESSNNSFISSLPTRFAGIQPKLKIGSPGDKYEQQADRVTNKVMHMPDSQVQRQCMDCEEKKSTIQTKTSGQRNTKQSVVSEAQLHESKCAGQPLPASSRNFFEPRFGQDFSNVRVHTCNNAVQMSRNLNAQAFTFKNNIFFNENKYDPGTSSGKSLLAHELTHVVQQGSSQKSGTGAKVQTLKSDTTTENDLECNGTGYPPADIWFSHPTLARIRAGDALMAYGWTGEPVALVQQAVVAWGCEAGFNHLLPRFGVDGIFGSETRSAVRTFQQGQTISDDGIVGPITMGELDRYISGGQQFCPSGTQPSAFVAASEANPMQTMCVPPGTQPLSKNCPCGCPLPAPSGANPSVGDTCKVQKNATSVDDNNILFCPNENDPVQVIAKEPDNFVKVELCKHRNKEVHIKSDFLKDCAPLSITAKTKIPAPDGSGRFRSDVGVGEKVDLSGGIEGKWAATAGSPKNKNNVSSFTWTAPNRAQTVMVSYSVGSTTKFLSLEVIEPKSITANKVREITTIPAGTAGAGMKLRFHYHPKNVSFGNVESKEVSGPASRIEGYYKNNYTKDELKHDSKDRFFDIRNNNTDEALDTAKDIRKKKPYKWGTYAWVIPNNFKVKTESGNGKKFTEVTQFIHMVDDTGRIRVLKAGAKVDRSP